MRSRSCFSIFGPNSFIGSNLINFLQQKGEIVHQIHRNRWPPKGSDLGNIVYSIGITGSFKSEPFSTVAAHVSLLEKALEWYSFGSFTYLSSVRVYKNGKNSHEESDIKVNPTKIDDIYNITKLCGEAACFACGSDNVRVVRLSNIIGGRRRSKSFLPTIFAQVEDNKSVIFTGSPDIVKDYISTQDALEGIYSIALGGLRPLYNLASGVNTSNGQIAEILKSLGVEVTFRVQSKNENGLIIDNRRYVSEFETKFLEFEDVFKLELEKYIF